MLYLAPAGGETFFHMDADGIADAGHYCISGLNHVIILRRLSKVAEEHLKTSQILCFEDYKKQQKGEVGT